MEVSVKQPHTFMFSGKQAVNNIYAKRDDGKCVYKWPCLWVWWSRDPRIPAARLTSRFVATITALSFPRIALRKTSLIPLKYLFLAFACSHVRKWRNTEPMGTAIRMKAKITFCGLRRNNAFWNRASSSKRAKTALFKEGVTTFWQYLTAHVRKKQHKLKYNQHLQVDV